MSFVQRRPLPPTVLADKPELRPGTSSSHPSRPETTASQATTRPGTRHQDLQSSRPHTSHSQDPFPLPPDGSLPPISRPATGESDDSAKVGTRPSLLKRGESTKRPPLGSAPSRKLLLFDQANVDESNQSPSTKRFAKSQLRFDESFKRRKDRAQLKEEARQRFIHRLAELSARLPPRPTAQELLAQLDRGFPPVPLSSGASGDLLRPAPAPPRGWENIVRNTRHFRATVSRKLEQFDSSRQRRALRSMKECVLEMHYWKDKFQEVRSRLFYCFSQIKTDTFVAWIDLTKQLVVMRRKAKKIAIWLMNREVVRAWGAWVAIWAHGKDWRIFALKGAIQARLKKATRFEVETLLKSKRGKALFRDLSDLTMDELLERIMVTKLDFEALMMVTVEEYMELKVFRPEDRDRAERLVWKMGRLVQEDTSRLDRLHIWKGSLLLNVDVYQDDFAVKLTHKDAGGEVEGAEEEEEEDLDQLETRLLQFEAHPTKAVDSAWQTMIAGTESMLSNWGWGYVLHLSKLPALLHGISSRMILQDTCIAFGYLVHIDQNKCIAMSEIVRGRSPSIEWYQFDFRDFPLHHGLALVVAMSDRGQQLSASASNKFCYTLDHHTNRTICKTISVDPGSFDGRWNFTPAARCISMELQLVVDGTFEAEEPTDEKAAGGRSKGGAAGGQEEPLDEKEHLLTLLEALAGMRSERDAGRAVDLKQMDDLHVQLRKRVLDRSTEEFEPTVGYVHERRLWLDVAVDCPCCFNPLMNEFWVLDTEKMTNFLICDAEGSFVREFELVTSMSLRVYFMTFDGSGDLYVGSDNSMVLRFRPTKPLVSDHFFKLWMVSVPGGTSPLSLTTHDESVICLFQKGPIVTLEKGTGAVQRTIHLQFAVHSAGAMVCAMKRLIFVDVDCLRVVSLDGELIQVPVGGMTVKKTKKGPVPTIVWTDKLAWGLDNPAILWDGSFLWVSNSQFRKTNDDNLKTKRFGWSCFAPCSEPDDGRFGGRVLQELDMACDETGTWELTRLTKHDYAQHEEAHTSLGDSFAPDAHLFKSRTSRWNLAGPPATPPRTRPPTLPGLRTA